MDHALPVLVSEPVGLREGSFPGSASKTSDGAPELALDKLEVLTMSWTSTLPPTDRLGEALWVAKIRSLPSICPSEQSLAVFVQEPLAVGPTAATRTSSEAVTTAAGGSSGCCLAPGQSHPHLVEPENSEQ